MAISPHLKARADEYVDSQQITVDGILGYGKDGAAWHSSRLSAIKIHGTHESYIIERNADIRLGDCAAKKVAGFSLPKMLDHDDEHLAIEMIVVTPPASRALRVKDSIFAVATNARCRGMRAVGEHQRAMA